MTVRPIRIEGDVAYVPLTKGYEAIIDAADVPLVSGRNWQAGVDYRENGTIRNVYARAAGGVRMHRVIAGAEGRVEVDHRDGVGLNNRRKNLRIADKSKNQHNARLRIDNTSGVKGVSLNQRTGKWLAHLRLGGVRKNLGSFASFDEAVLVVSAARKDYHGEFGRAA